MKKISCKLSTNGKGENEIYSSMFELECKTRL